MNHRLAGAATALVALAALGIVYFAQYRLLLTPCELCLWERWPYRIVVVLGVLAVLLPRRAALVALGLAALAMLGDIGIAGVHVGVEFGWWASPLPECNGELTPGAPLPMFPAIPCDRPVYLVHGLPLSMAHMALCAALAFTILLTAYVWRAARRDS